MYLRRHTPAKERKKKKKKKKKKKPFLLSMPAITSPWNEKAPAVMVDRWSKADLYA